MRFLLLSIAIAAIAAPASAGPASPAPVIAAERAFAADAAARGWIPAFQATVAPDGVELDPDPVNAAQKVAATPDDHFTGLSWRPAFAGVARAGDLGFTTGPYFVRGRDGVAGHYFTVWRKQPDGSWKWIFDGGVPVADSNPIAPDAAPAEMRTATYADGRLAEGEIGALESQIAGGDALPNQALAARLSDDARVNRAGAPPAIGREAAAALMAQDPAMQFSIISTTASRAGDLVFTLGEAHWSADGADKRGYYARIWQRQREGWRLVFDEIIPRGAG